MGDKTWQSYENLTQVIFQSIIDQKQFPNLKVERNVVLQGKETSHQIDIYWQFEVGGVPHEVIVQVKDWGKPVDQGQLLLFKGVLDDLPGQPKGVFVTRSGYQLGAKDYALAHGIVLYELKEWEQPPMLGITLEPIPAEAQRPSGKLPEVPRDWVSFLFLGLKTCIRPTKPNNSDCDRVGSA
jgi:hypothetical protein